ncbi:MAG: tetratricopeptide repeat protein [Microcoleaceae cyanobacterium]
MQKIKEKNSVDAYLKKAKQLKLEGKQTQAIQQYQQALQLDSNCVTALEQLAKIHSKRKEYDPALNYYQHLAELQPNDGIAQANIAKIMMRQGQIQEAIAIYKTAITLQNVPTSVYEELGKALEKNSQLEEAIATYQQAINLEPDNPEFYLRQSQLYLKQKNIDQAIEKAETALQLNPDFAPALNQLAEIHKQKNQLDQAIHYYQRLVKIQPEQFNHLIEVYSKILAKKDDIEEVITAYKKLLSEANKSNQIEIIHEYLGHTILKLSTRQNQLDRLISFFQETAEIKSNSPWLHYNLGLTLAKQDRLDEARSYYKKAITLNPKFWQALISLAQVFADKGNQEKAFKYRLKAVKINPDLPRKYYKDWNPHSSESWDLLKTTFQENLDKKEDHKPKQYFQIGNKLSQNGELSEASDYYQKSIYNRLKKYNPQFIRQYWETGTLQPPDFVVIGVAKCGTTAFYKYLSQHPQFLPSIVKEPNYLKTLLPKLEKSDGEKASLPDSYKDFYMAHFPPRPEENQFITGEASTSNWNPGIEKIVSNWFPNVKLIAVLRNPIQRAISLYNFSIENRTKSFIDTFNKELNFLEKVTDFKASLENDSIHDQRHLGRGLYVYYLQRWMALFPKEQFLIITNEELAQNPAGVMKQTFEFLGLPEYNAINYTPRNVGHYPKDIDPNLLSRLQEFYRPHNQKLENLLGRELNWD